MKDIWGTAFSSTKFWVTWEAPERHMHSTMLAPSAMKSDCGMWDQVCHLHVSLAMLQARLNLPSQPLVQSGCWSFPYQEKLFLPGGNEPEAQILQTVSPWGLDNEGGREEKKGQDKFSQPLLSRAGNPWEGMIEEWREKARCVSLPVVSPYERKESERDEDSPLKLG